MDEQEIDLSSIRWNHVEMAEQAAQRMGDKPENTRRTRGEQSGEHRENKIGNLLPNNKLRRRTKNPPKVQRNAYSAVRVGGVEGDRGRVKRHIAESGSGTLDL